MFVKAWICAIVGEFVDGEHDHGGGFVEGAEVFEFGGCEDTSSSDINLTDEVEVRGTDEATAAGITDPASFVGVVVGVGFHRPNREP